MAEVPYELAGAPDSQDKMFVPMFLCGVRNAHTIVKGMSAIDVDDTLNASTDLAFCFAHGESVTEMGDATGRYYGSPMCRSLPGTRFVDAAGNEYTYSLIYVGEDGAYNRFWRAYDAFLRHANHTVELDVNFTRSLINTMDMSKPIMLMGQLLMIDKTSRRLPMSGVSAAMTTFRTMKLLEPYDLASEQNPRQIVSQSTAWEFFSNQDAACEAALKSLEGIARQNFNEVYPYATIVYMEESSYSVAESDTIDLSLWESSGAPTSEDVVNGRAQTETFSCKIAYNILFYCDYGGDEGNGYYNYNNILHGLYSVTFTAGVRAVRRG